MWQHAVLLFAGGFFLLAFAAAFYVLLRFLSLALTLDNHLLREFRDYRQQLAFARQSAAARPPSPTHNNPADLEFPATPDMVAAHLARNVRATDGGFEPCSDEDAWRAEAAAQASAGRMTPEQIENFIRQAVGAEAEEPGKE